jgi:hypothetical protein
MSYAVRPLTPEEIESLARSGKYGVQPFGTPNVYGPFDTLDEAQKWANLQADLTQRAEDRKFK